MLTKLCILAYSDPTLETRQLSHTLMVNSADLRIERDQEFKAIGAEEREVEFRRQPSETLHVNAILDASGVVVPGVSSVERELGELRAAVFDFNGEIHRPYYLRLVWADQVFPARLKDMSVEYTLFKPDGTPLRAKVKLTFLRQEADRF